MVAVAHQSTLSKLRADSLAQPYCKTVVRREYEMLNAAEYTLIY